MYRMVCMVCMVMVYMVYIWYGMYSLKKQRFYIVRSKSGKKYGLTWRISLTQEPFNYSGINHSLPVACVYLSACGSTNLEL
jgi:hypothetical protein